MGFLEILFGTNHDDIGYDAESAKKKTEEVIRINTEKEYKEIHNRIDIAVNCGESKIIHMIKYKDNIDALRKFGYSVKEVTTYYDVRYEISW